MYVFQTALQEKKSHYKLNLNILNKNKKIQIVSLFYISVYKFNAYLNVDKNLEVEDNCICIALARKIFILKLE